MRDLFQLVLGLSWGLAVFSRVPEFDISDSQFIQECVREHNLKRSSVIPDAANMRYMTWDAALAVTARAWARFCLFKHNVHMREKGRMHPSFNPVSENIWAGAPYGTFSVSTAVGAWIQEQKDYDHRLNQCQPQRVCGHYTQVIWAESYKVGCAAQACPDGIADTSFSTQPGVIFICNYAPAGNMVGKAPYQEGEACSGCLRDECEDSLCRNSTRDADLTTTAVEPSREHQFPDCSPRPAAMAPTAPGYSWTPDWDPELSSCGWDCVMLLSVRLLSVPLLFLLVYGLQTALKPFAYE